MKNCKYVASEETELTKPEQSRVGSWIVYRYSKQLLRPLPVHRL